MKDQLGDFRPGEPIGGSDRAHRGNSLTSLLVMVAVLAFVLAVIVLQFTGSSSLIERLGQWAQVGIESSTSSVEDVSELGIARLPRSVTLRADVRPFLDRLRREACDSAAIVPLAESLERAGYPRQASEALESFFDRCKGHPELLDASIETLFRIGDYRKAHDLAGKLVVIDPAYGRYRYLRGVAAEKLGLLQESLRDQIVGFNLLGDPRFVAGSVYYEVARAYARLGRFCEAVTTIQQFVSYGADRATPQTNALVKEFSDAGDCGSSYASTNGSFSMANNGEVMEATVVINGVEGRFIIDTGASFVSVSEGFARKAGITWSTADEIEVLTANGRSTRYLSTIERIKLGTLEAHNVSASIAPEGAFEHIDGLLGMSFLARFRVTVSPTTLSVEGVQAD